MLLVQGALWKLIVFVSGYFGMYTLLVTYLPNSKHTCLIFDHNHISWAMVVPTVIIILALAYTKSE